MILIMIRKPLVPGGSRSARNGLNAGCVGDTAVICCSDGYLDRSRLAVAKILNRSWLAVAKILDRSWLDPAAGLGPDASAACGQSPSSADVGYRDFSSYTAVNGVAAEAVAELAAAAGR